MDMKSRFGKSTDKIKDDSTKIEDDAVQKEQQFIEARKIINSMRDAVQYIAYRENGKLKMKIFCHYDMIDDKILEENND